MSSLFSFRFGLPVVVTTHARLRMEARSVDDSILMDVIETGTDRIASGTHHWLFKELPNRSDNLVCAAVAIEGVLVVKTVMHHWKPSP